MKLPRTTRLAIVTLYLRYRRARKQVAIYCGGSEERHSHYGDIKLREIEAWNSLQAVQNVVWINLLLEEGEK